MNYCPKCGAYIPDGQTKCVACGFNNAEKPKEEKKEKSEYSYSYGTGGAAAQAAPEQEKQEYNYKYSQGTAEEDGRTHGYYDPSGRVNNQSWTSTAPDMDDDVVRNKALAALSYIGPLFIITLLSRRQSRFAMYHANQGLMLFLLEIVVGIASAVIPWLGWVVDFVGGILIFIAFVSGIINAVNGVMKPIPFVGNVTLIN